MMVDFWFPTLNLVIEIQGGVMGRKTKFGHASNAGMTKDGMKQLILTVNGIRQIEMTPKMVQDWDIIDFILHPRPLVDFKEFSSYKQLLEREAAKRKRKAMLKRAKDSK
jgi:hypothetical protein